MKLRLKVPFEVVLLLAGLGLAPWLAFLFDPYYWRLVAGAL